MPMKLKDKNSSLRDVQSLVKGLTADISAAVVSASLVAPLVTAIDRAVVENAANASKRRLLPTLRSHLNSLITKPTTFINSKPFFLVWTLYAVTYATANSAETIAASVMPHAEQAVISSIVFLPTFAVNVPLGVWKDVRFAQMFGSNSLTTNPSIPKKVVSTSRLPVLASSAFLFRDGITLFGSFALTPLMSSFVPDSLARSEHAKVVATQLFAPILSQLFATPLHITGLDLIGRPGTLGWTERTRIIRETLGPTTLMRCVRILPAFGFGCVVNTELRQRLNSKAPEDPQENRT